MRATVKEVISDLTIEIDELWTFHGIQGRRVKIAGLVPSKREESQHNKEVLQKLIKDKIIMIEDFLFVSGDSLYAIVSYDGKPIQQNFPERVIPAIEPSRWYEPEEKKFIGRVFGGIPLAWRNPIASYPIKKAPFFGSIKYPVKTWEKDYKRDKQLAEALYVDSHHNKNDLNRWFKTFLQNPPREAPLLVIGDVGVGKSWWISHTLMHLDHQKYHAIVIDLRYTMRGADLKRSIALEIDEFLTHNVKDLTWLYPDFEAIYGKDFDPENLAIKEKMIEAALRITDVYERNRKRLRFYDRLGSPELVVAFDNIDHFNEEEQSIVLDMCRRIIGYSSGVKAIVALRPTTILPKSRSGLFFGDAISAPLLLKSPNVYDMLERRLCTNLEGEKLSLTNKISYTNITWRELLEVYKKSDHILGTANLVKELCCSDVLLKDTTGRFNAEKSSPVEGTYDIRHYLKLFRRLLRSDTLDHLENIGNLYYAIHALLLSGKEPLMESDAYLFNLFDNEKPLMRGNALVRYRVLEYCNIFHDLGEIFNIYFSALGCGVEIARSLVNLFADAGLIKVSYKEDEQGNEMPVQADLTIAGQRHLEVVTNLWYIICIKTGMNIYSDYILWGEEAKAKASEFVKSDRILDYYAEHGWVSEDDFVEFLGIQELLEYKRIGSFQESHPIWSKQVANMVELISSPATNIYFSYKVQLEYWRRAHKTL